MVKPSAAKPRRLDGYVRVSRRLGREGPGYISPEVQREAIQRWADCRGLEIAAWFVDEDESGGTQDRPGLRAIIERIENGDTDGIAVWRLNRFARNVAGAIQEVERIQNAGGVLASIEEDIDPTGPFGNFILTVLLAVASLERDNLVAGWKTAKGRAVERGAKISRTPLGYQRRDDGGIEPDPKTAPIVLEAFTRAAQDGLPGTIDYLRESAPERTWTTFTVRRTLANRCYLGESRSGELVNVGAHEAIVPRGIFEAAQHDVDDDRRTRPAAAYPLSGVARCAACGERMVGGRGGRAPDGTGLRVYRCRASLAGFKGDSAPPRRTSPQTA
jgi:site-specific DNA recombinase